MLISTLISTFSLNILSIIRWTIFNLIISLKPIKFTLNMVQKAKKSHYENIIDVQYEKIEF